jgi:hypothetical protein
MKATHSSLFRFDATVSVGRVCDCVGLALTCCRLVTGVGIGGLRLHIVERCIVIDVWVVGHCVWWWLINGGVEFVIRDRVGVLELLKFTRALTALQATALS